MKYTNYRNEVFIEGNLMRDPSFYLDEDEGCDAGHLFLSSVFSNDDEKEVTYVNVIVYEESLIKLLADLGKGTHIRVQGRLAKRKVPDSPSLMGYLVVLADEIEFKPK